MTYDYFTKEAREHLADVRANITKYVPVYALEHDRNVKALERLAMKYGFTFDVAASHQQTPGA